MIKLGLLLSMFSCMGSDKMKRRMNCHILIMGEPGMGKSELLKWVESSMKCVYISGPAVSSVGLTVSINKD